MSPEGLFVFEYSTTKNLKITKSEMTSMTFLCSADVCTERTHRVKQHNTTAHCEK